MLLCDQLMYGDPFRLFVFGGWKIDSDPPIASAGLRCLTFHIPVSDIVGKRKNEFLLKKIQNFFLLKIKKHRFDCLSQ